MKGPNKSRKQGKKKKSRKVIKQKGGVNVISSPKFLSTEAKYYNVKTINELKEILIKENPNKYINLRLTPSNSTNIPYELSMNLPDKFTIYCKLIDILPPIKLAEFILKEGSDYDDLDYFLIDRNTLKFAASVSGVQGPKSSIIKYSIESYLEGYFNQGPDDDFYYELLDILTNHFGFKIEYLKTGVTFYDSDSANLLLKLFQDKGMLTGLDIDTILNLPNEHPHKMEFIYILFGEIQHIPDGPEPFFTNKKKDIVSANNIYYENLSPEIQEIIMTIKSMILGKN